MADASPTPMSPDEVTRAREEQVPRSAEPQHAKLRYQKTASPAEQLAALAALFHGDKKIEKRRKILLIAAITCGVLGFITWIFFIGIGFVLLAAVLLLWRYTLSSRDLEDRKLHAARYVIEVLAPELKPGRPVTVHLDFGGYHKTVPTFDDISWGSGARTYTNPGWLKMSMTLLDGTQVRVVASTKAKRKQRRKRKYTKIKDALLDELDIELRTPSGRSLEGIDAAKLEQRFRGAHALRLKRCQVKPREAAFAFRTDRALRLRVRNGWQGRELESLLDGRGVLEGIVASYQALALERRAEPVPAHV